MVAGGEREAAEIRQLKACISDLISIQALPTIWSGGPPSAIVSILLDALLEMLELAFVFIRVKETIAGSPIEAVRFAADRSLSVGAREFGQVLTDWLGDFTPASLSLVRKPLEGGVMSAAFCPLGLQGELGLLAAGCGRTDFPTPAEKLLLNLATNQATIGLHHVAHMTEQSRIAFELDREVARRTNELVKVNEELRREIADRKRAAEQLRRSEAYLAEAQRLSQTGVFGWTPSTGDLHWSDESFRIFEIDPTVKPTVELALQRVHPDDRALVRQLIDEASRGEKGFDVMHRLLMPNGSVKYVHVVSHAVTDGAGNLEVVGALMNITAAKRAEDAFHRAQAELSHVTRVATLGELTASITHEVNQPLASIVTNAETGLRWLARATPNIEEARSALERIIRDAHRASAVVRRTRELYKKADSEKARLDINDVISDAILLVQRQATNSEVSLRVELSPELPAISGDRVQLQQVVINLVINGVEAMQDIADRPRELWIRSRLHDEGGVLVAIEDAGVGIAPEDIDRLFQAFFTTKRTGMGMGLSISRSIIESHGGCVWAVPNAGPGATFNFALPRMTGGSAR
jgi:signal transduction histidine kinase